MSFRSPGYGLRLRATTGYGRFIFVDTQRARPWEKVMTNDSTLSLPEIENRIAILRANIRQLTEQAAAASGAADEMRNADRIAEQEEELRQLVAQRDEIMKRRK